MRHDHLFIDGKWVESASGAVYTRRNPATGDIVSQHDRATPEETEAAIRAARELYDGFSGAIQSQVANRDVLVRDEEQYAALRIQHVDELIDAIGEVTLSSEDRIREAEDAYNGLSESEAASVTNHRVLVEARETFDTMEAAARLQVAIDDARSRLRVTRLEVKPLEAGGAELHFSFVNESEQTIHYVYYGVTFYDAEGVVISLESTGAEICERVASGPFAHGGGTEDVETLWGGDGREPASVCLAALSVEYEDGSVYTFSDEQLTAILP